MEYTVHEMAQLAGVSVRTLHWYDKQGLLPPCRTTQAGYRMYGAREVDALQSILLYRALGFSLKEIGEILRAPDYDRAAALQAHREALVRQRQRLDTLLTTLDKTIAEQKGELQMQDNEKFEGLKQTLVAENEKQYGAEVRAAYGDAAVDASNAKLMGLSAEQYEAMQKLGADIHAALAQAVRAGEAPSGEAGKQIAAQHKQWLLYTWHKYTPQMHKGLAEGYVADERFTAYYDAECPGCAQFLRDAIVAWA